MTFTITKVSDKNFNHSDGLKEMNFSNWEIVFNNTENTLILQMRNGAPFPRKEVLATDVIIKNGTVGTPETYATTTLIRARLIELGYNALVTSDPSGATSWGSITGTLADQTDLQTELDGKVSKSGDTMTGVLTIETSGVDVEKNALILVNPLDEAFRNSITVQAGDTANQRRYFQFLNHLGVRTNLLGFNAQDGFIAYDSVNAYHFISCNSNGTSSFNSKGTNQVRINADEGVTGTNGMSVYDGTANPTGANIMYNLSSAGIYANSGRLIQAFAPNNTDFIKIFSTAGSAYLQSSLALRLYNAGNKFNFANSSLVDKMVIDTANARLGIGITTPTVPLDVVGNGKFTGTVEIANGTASSHAVNYSQLYTPRVQTVTSSATVTPVSTNDIVTITAQATGLTLDNPTGTFLEGQALMIRIKDNGTAQTIALGSNYRAIGVTLPATTVISKTLYLGIIYNSTDAKWDVLGINQQA